MSKLGLEWGIEQLHAPHHELGGGEAELEGRHHPENGLKVQEEFPLPDNTAVPVRGPVTLSEHPLQSRMNQKVVVIPEEAWVTALTSGQFMKALTSSLDVTGE